MAKYALCIGIDAYKQDNGIAPLQGAVNDATLMRQRLKDAGFQARLLRDVWADTVFDALFTIGQKLRAGDTFVLYFAGHGTPQKLPSTHPQSHKPDQLFLCANANAAYLEGNHSYSPGILAWNALKTTIGQWQQPVQCLFLFDACRRELCPDAKRDIASNVQFASEGVFRDVQPIATTTTKHPCTIINACLDGQSAEELPDYDGQKHGLFTASLTELIAEATKQNQALHIDNALIQRLSKRMQHNAQKYGAKQQGQTPMFSGETVELLSSSQSPTMPDADETQWQICQAKGQLQDYEDFVKHHPTSSYKTAALDAIARLAKEQRDAQARQANAQQEQAQRQAAQRAAEEAAHQKQQEAERAKKQAEQEQAQRQAAQRAAEAAERQQQAERAKKPAEQQQPQPAAHANPQTPFVMLGIGVIAAVVATISLMTLLGRNTSPNTANTANTAAVAAAASVDANVDTSAVDNTSSTNTAAAVKTPPTPKTPARPPTPNFANWQVLETLKGHNHSVQSVAFSPNGQFIASGSWDNTIKLWNAQSGDLIHTLKGHKDSVNSVAFSPNGQLIASGGWDDTIKLWNTQSGTFIRTIGKHDNVVTSVAFSPNGQLIASGGWDDTIKLWNAQSGELIHTLKGHKTWVWSVAFSPNGQLIASGSGGIGGDNTIKLWNAHSGKLIHTLTGHSRSVTSVAFSPNGQLIASGSFDDTIKLWNAQSGDLIHTLKGHKDLVSSVAFSPNGQIIASGSNDKTIKLWNTQSGTFIRTIGKHDNVVTSVAFSPNGQLIASGSNDKTIKLWGDAPKNNTTTSKKQQASSLRFADYPATVVDINQSNRRPAIITESNRDMRTRLRNLADTGTVGFAGRYALTGVGCGGGCVFWLSMDLTTGKELGGASLPSVTYCRSLDSIELLKKPNSRLLALVGLSDDHGDEQCFVRYYVEENGKLSLLKKEPWTKSSIEPLRQQLNAKSK